MVAFYTISKFKTKIRRQWDNQLGDTDDPPTMDQLKEFIKTRTITLESIKASQKAVGSQSAKPSQKKGSNFNSTNSKIQSAHQISSASSSSSNKNSKQKRNKYLVCSGEHALFQCEDFKMRIPAERKTMIFKLIRCFNCLGTHFSKDWKSDKRCFYCREKHTNSCFTRTDKILFNLKMVVTPQTLLQNPETIPINTVILLKHPGCTKMVFFWQL